MKLGSRGSALALAQAGMVRDSLVALGQEVELVVIQTAGDERPAGSPPPETRDKERFVKEIEEALLDGRIDMAVHSAKDVPGKLADGLAIVGVPERADPRDALCGARSLEDLPTGAAVGTASVRRRSQLLAARPDLRVRDVRGNVDTRLRKLAGGDYDALVLAAAGLARLGRDEGTPVDASVMLPAPGQGCLALEGREGDEAVGELAVELTDFGALVALTAERALVARLDATCDTPVGALARLEGQTLLLEGFAGMPDGASWIRDGLEGPAREPADLGAAVGDRLLAAGARELLDTAEGMAG